VSRKALVLAVALVVVVGLGSFATALHGTFVNWDDEWLILKNPFLRGFHHLPTILDPFSDRVLLGAEYLPVRDLSNLVDFHLFGLEPLGYRIGNWILYGAACALAFALLLEALKSPAAALAGALLWAAHPIHAEVVAWASARKDLLNAVFALLAGWLWLRAGRTGSRGLGIAAVAAFVLATLSKTSAAALPLVLAAWEAVSGDPAVPLGRRLLASLRRAAPLIVVGAAGAAFNAAHQGQGWIKAEWRGGSRLANLFVMAGVHLRYLRQTLLPGGMAADYAVNEADAGSLANVLGLGAIAVLAAATLGAARLGRRGAFAGLWWFGMLAPVSNLLVPLTNASADRYLFLPGLGAAALGGLGFERLLAAGPAAARAARGALAAIVLAFAVLANAQAAVWRDGVSLWTHATEVSPRCGRAWLNRGEALAAAGRVDEALECYRTMIEVEPRNAVLWTQAGNRLWQIGGREKAAEVERILRAAVDRAEPGTGAPLVALAWVLNATGRPAEAVRLLQEAVRRQPTLAHGHLNLGIWHAAERRWGEAVREIEEAVRLGLPLHDLIDAHERLARIHATLGDDAASRRHRAERERLKALTWGE
jgi:tetratricopeptide (TPR) repeat protein